MDFPTFHVIRIWLLRHPIERGEKKTLWTACTLLTLNAILNRKGFKSGENRKRGTGGEKLSFSFVLWVVLAHGLPWLCAFLTQSKGVFVRKSLRQLSL